MPAIEFTVVAEHLFVDDELSMEGLELLATLVRLADDGKMDQRGISKARRECSQGACQFDELLDELVEQGYIRYHLPTERRSEKRQWMVRPIDNEQAA